MREKNWHPLDDVTKENYKVKPSERGYFHVIVETPTYDTVTGERLSKPHIVKWNREEGRNMLDTCIHQMHMSVRVLHDPIEAAKGETAKANEAGDEGKNAEIEALKAELAAKNAALAEKEAQLEQAEKNIEAAKEEKSNPSDEIGVSESTEPAEATTVNSEQQMAEAAWQATVQPKSKTTKKK